MQNFVAIAMMFFCGLINAAEININSLEELAFYASKSENVITMSPEVYSLTDYLPAESMVARRNQKLFQFIVFKYFFF